MGRLRCPEGETRFSRHRLHHHVRSRNNVLAAHGAQPALNSSPAHDTWSASFEARLLSNTTSGSLLSRGGGTGRYPAGEEKRRFRLSSMTRTQPPGEKGGAAPRYQSAVFMLPFACVFWSWSLLQPPSSSVRPPSLIYSRDCECLLPTGRHLFTCLRMVQGKLNLKMVHKCSKDVASLSLPSYDRDTGHDEPSHSGQSIRETRAELSVLRVLRLHQGGQREYLS